MRFGCAYKISMSACPTTCAMSLMRFFKFLSPGHLIVYWDLWLQVDWVLKLYFIIGEINMSFDSLHLLKWFCQQQLNSFDWWLLSVWMFQSFAYPGNGTDSSSMIRNFMQWYEVSKFSDLAAMSQAQDLGVTCVMHDSKTFQIVWERSRFVLRV